MSATTPETPSTTTTSTAPEANTAKGPFAGRHRADFPEGTVVFLIGMRINQLWNVRKWVPVASAMGPMLRELGQHPELGMLDAKGWFSGRDLMVQQYWTDIDHLMRYSTARDAAHLPAWQRYNRAVGHTNPAVGVWHEAYTVDPQTSHIVYVNMPAFGIAKATTLRTAREMGPQSVTRRADATTPIPED